MPRIPLRWIYHLVAGSADVVRRRVEESARFAPSSLKTEGFVHGSFLPEVRASAQLYLANEPSVFAVPIDARRVDVPIELAATPRGPMPHLKGSIPRDALGAPLPLTPNEALDGAPDAVLGTRIALVTRGQGAAAKRDMLHDALVTRFGDRVALLTVDADRTTARPVDFDALLFVDPAARSWASGLPRNRRVFAAGPKTLDEVDTWLSFASDAPEPSDAAPLGT